MKPKCIFHFVDKETKACKFCGITAVKIIKGNEERKDSTNIYTMEKRHYHKGADCRITQMCHEINLKCPRQKEKFNVGQA